ncbi:transposase [Chitinophaga nivalis]|uniref:Transposase n=1 Tax=Chitinophaga nivalis TaxID=2991709 RepID=A0ABT3IS78_9BACT|nr:transposase [Chitinophaga nivalis]MCW3463474.1 transposase [Chitinophaga nivalis]MCW3486836.1 transposase [Chitinophaga nivalis]
MSQRKTYSKDFKEEALRLVTQSEVTQIVQDPGIHPNMLYM